MTPQPLQLDLGPLTPVHEPELTIDERFTAFHAANPHVYRNLVALARDLHRPGRRIGMKMLFEVLRWQHLRTTGDQGFALNNDLTSRYARLIAAREADLADAFETRVLRAA
jgi:hypothetical protein